MKLSLYSKRTILDYLLYHHELVCKKEEQQLKEADDKYLKARSDLTFVNAPNIAARHTGLLRRNRIRQSIHSTRSCREDCLKEFSRSYAYCDINDCKNIVQTFRKILREEDRVKFDNMELHPKFCAIVSEIASRLHQRAWGFELIQIKFLAAKEKQVRGEKALTEHKLVNLLQDPFLRDNRLEHVTKAMPPQPLKAETGIIIALKKIHESYNDRAEFIAILQSETSRLNSCHAFLALADKFEVHDCVLSHKSCKEDFQLLKHYTDAFKNFMHVFADVDKVGEYPQVQASCAIL